MMRPRQMLRGHHLLSNQPYRNHRPVLVRIAPMSSFALAWYTLSPSGFVATPGATFLAPSARSLTVLWSFLRSQLTRSHQLLLYVYLVTNHISCVLHFNYVLLAPPHLRLSEKL